MSKLDKEEILRHYRIANFEDETKMLELIAHKKGLVDQVAELVGKKKVKKMVPNVQDAARRLIRDFLNNRLRFYSKC